MMILDFHKISGSIEAVLAGPQYRFRGPRCSLTGIRQFGKVNDVYFHSQRAGRARSAL
jgi:hypothetical protein